MKDIPERSAAAAAEVEEKEEEEEEEGTCTNHYGNKQGAPSFGFMTR